MIRYKLYRETEAVKLFLQACYEPQHDGIIFTPLDEDACEYVTVEKAAQVARSITRLQGFDVCIQAVDDGK